jgi:tRNA U54 and U55 pseudouridine synthase Pus10
MSVRLCEGCGRELVGKRRGAKAHGATCRSKKKRRLDRESREPEFCPCCGGATKRLDDFTGWCRSCTREAAA